MQVRIHEPGKNGPVAEIMDFIIPGGHLIRGDNSLDLLSLNQYGGRANSVGSDYPASDEGLQTQDINSFIRLALEINSIESAPVFTTRTSRKSKHHFTSF
jgi:hypothetical protein